MRSVSPAAKGGFQVSQTAKARLGPPCAVTPIRTWPPACRNNNDEESMSVSVRVCSHPVPIPHVAAALGPADSVERALCARSASTRDRLQLIANAGALLVHSSSQEYSGEYMRGRNDCRALNYGPVRAT